MKSIYSLLLGLFGLITSLSAQTINEVQDFSAEVMYDSLTATYKVIEQGRASLSLELNSERYEAWHRSAEVGKFIRVINPDNGKFVVVRNVAPMPEKYQEEGMLIQISQKAYDKLGFEGFGRFEVELKYTTKLSRELIETLLNIQKGKSDLQEAQKDLQKDKLEQQRERLEQQGQLVSQWQQYFYTLLIISALLLLWALLQNQRKRHYRRKAEDYDRAEQRAQKLMRTRAHQLEMIYQNLQLPLDILQEHLSHLPNNKMRLSSVALEQVFSTLSQLNLLEDYQKKGIAANKTAQSLEQTIQQVIKQIEPLLDHKQIEMIDLVSEQISATYDPKLMEQSLKQLLMYALNRSPEGDIISLKVQNNGKAYIISLHYQDPALTKQDFERDLQSLNDLDARSLLNEGTCPLGLVFAKTLLEVQQSSLQMRFQAEGEQVLFFNIS